MDITTSIPYGKSCINLDIQPGDYQVDYLTPAAHKEPAGNSQEAVRHALSSPVSGESVLENITSDFTVGITINDKTRPVPNSTLLPPLLRLLESKGVKESNITLFIASGTHIPMSKEEYSKVLPPEIYNRYRIIPHNSDTKEQLRAIGVTFRGTPVFVNNEFSNCDLKIVVGDIELHHFAGYSGGVKPAAIGLAGRETINKNHKLLLDENSTIGVYENNPLREDIEEIGKMMKVDLALNAVLNEQKEILQVFFGKPVDVIKAGIRLVNEISQVHISQQYDLVIASAGGYPKDINLYQSQKAMTHAARFCRPGGTIVLFAECSDGVGSDGYLAFMRRVNSIEEVIKKFEEEDFAVGPHKAFQIARILQKHAVYLYSSLPDSLTRSLLLKPIDLFGEIQELVKQVLSSQGRVAVLPYATACLPWYKEPRHEN